MRFRDIKPFIREGSWECDFQLDSVLKFIDELIVDGMDTDPDFQRGHVWTEQQQINYLEFFLRGGKTGRVIYINHPGWQRDYKFTKDTFVLVDGKQRIQAVRRFINNEIKVFGYFYRDFDDAPDFMITFKINVNTLKTRKEIIEWYLGFNSGGTPHTPEEINRVRGLLKGETNNAS